jgi:hypothetical protein
MRARSHKIMVNLLLQLAQNDLFDANSFTLDAVAVGELRTPKSGEERRPWRGTAGSD